MTRRMLARVGLVSADCLWLPPRLAIPSGLPSGVAADKPFSTSSDPRRRHARKNAAVSRQERGLALESGMVRELKDIRCVSDAVHDILGGKVPATDRKRMAESRARGRNGRFGRCDTVLDLRQSAGGVRTMRCLAR